MKNVFFTLCAALLILAPAALADWSDNFDSYALGSGLHGQGGWEGWQGDPGPDAYVTDDQAYSTPHSAAIIPTSDIVQPFAETGGTWTMTAWCYVPSGSTGDQYFIMLNQYYPATNNWSVQIQFDSDAGNVIDYYSSSTTPIINDQWVKVNLDIHLDMNSYDIYYNDAFLASNAWQSGGSDAIAALDLFSDGGSTIYWDDLNLQGGGALEHTTWGNIKTVLQ
ncbi:MAG: hypothetical protein JXA64_04010 [Candidatus Fermentibacteraceae bacterium]|nr:hypothetical protein [Candidatus Fermentibacteraceae bacterium]MBN2608257.1 hypothetical protein [Candidatus Fermentibacteraceae bacterium]